MIEPKNLIRKLAVRASAHKFFGWAPPAALTGLLALAALGGESVRARIWDRIVMSVAHPASIPVVVIIAGLWAFAWWLTRDKKEETVVAPDHGMPSIEEIRTLIAPEKSFGETVLDRIMDTAYPTTSRTTAFAHMIEVQQQKAIEETIRSRFDMTLNQLVRRVAFESQWAAEFDPNTPTAQWQQVFWWKPLKKEIFRALVGGDLDARGILNRRGEDPDTGPTLIPIEFWRKSDFHPELMLTESSINSAGNGERGEIYTDIEVKSTDVDSLWSTRTKQAMQETPSPFVAWHQQWWQEQEEVRLNLQMATTEMVANKDANPSN